MSSRNISKKWLIENYWEKQKTDEEIAKERKVPLGRVHKLIREYKLQKKLNGIKLKGKKNYVMPEEEKSKHIKQKQAKEIMQISIKTGKVIRSFTSIAEASRFKKGWGRRTIGKAVDKENLTAYGFKWQTKKYKGEIIIERRINLNFKLDFEELQKEAISLGTNIPEWNYEDRVKHYINKLNNVWEKQNYKMG